MSEKSAADRVLEFEPKFSWGHGARGCFITNKQGIEMATLAPALARQVKALEANRCEHCGAKVSSYPNGCPGCGAPQCCQPCCDLQNARDRVKELEAERIQLQADLSTARLWEKNYREKVEALEAHLEAEALEAHLKELLRTVVAEEKQFDSNSKAFHVLCAIEDAILKRGQHD